MSTKPPGPMSFRFSPEVKTLLEKAAASEHRSQANFLEHLIRTYCSNHDISVDVPVTNVSTATNTFSKGQK